MEAVDYVLIIVMAGGPYGLAIWALIVEVRRTRR